MRVYKQRRVVCFMDIHNDAIATPVVSRGITVSWLANNHNILRPDTSEGAEYIAYINHVRCRVMEAGGECMVLVAGNLYTVIANPTRTDYSSMRVTDWLMTASGMYFSEGKLTMFSVIAQPADARRRGITHAVTGMLTDSDGRFIAVRDPEDDYACHVSCTGLNGSWHSAVGWLATPMLLR